MPQRPKRLIPSRGPLDLFGSEVRRYRTAAGLSLAQLADQIPFAASTIGDIERGETGCDRVFAEECDRVLDTREALTHLHDGLFDGRSAAFPEHFAKWPDHEAQAETLRSYQPLVIDGLLQTPSYAEVLLYGDQQAVPGPDRPAGCAHQERTASSEVVLYPPGTGAALTGRHRRGDVRATPPARRRRVPAPVLGRADVAALVAALKR